MVQNLGSIYGALENLLSVLPPENASKHGRQAIPSGDTVTSDPKPVFQKWIGGGLPAREFSKVHQILKISLGSSKIPTY